MNKNIQRDIISMIFFINDDLWIEIKKYLFHRHLWNLPIYIRYNKVINNLPRCRISSKAESKVTSSEKYDKFIKIIEQFNWNDRNSINLISFIFFQKTQHKATEIYISDNYSTLNIIV